MAVHVFIRKLNKDNDADVNIVFSNLHKKLFAIKLRNIQHVDTLCKWTEELKILTIANKDGKNDQNYYKCHDNTCSSCYHTCKELHWPRQAKKYLRACAKYADSHHPVHVQSFIRAVTLPWKIFNESPDQTERVGRLIRGFDMPVDTFFAWRGPYILLKHVGDGGMRKYTISFKVFV